MFTGVLAEHRSVFPSLHLQQLLTSEQHGIIPGGMSWSHRHASQHVSSTNTE
jgi:hypothetical protein